MNAKSSKGSSKKSNKSKDNKKAKKDEVKGKSAKSASKAQGQAQEFWKPEPDSHDYPAAADYLSLLFAKPAVTKMVKALKAAPLSHRKSKDLLRASQLPLLPVDNAHVAKDLDKIKSGQMLSPVLLVRGDGTRDVPLEVADGYHRICASYHTDEDADIPCRIASIAPGDGRPASGRRRTRTS